MTPFSFEDAQKKPSKAFGWDEAVQKPKSSSSFGWEEATTKVKDTSGISALTKSAVENTLPATAAWSAFPAGAATGTAIASPLAPFTFGLSEPVGFLVGGVAAAGAAAWATSKAQSAIMSAVPREVKKATGFDVATRKAEEKEHPYMSFAGSIAPNLLTMRPGSLETVSIAGREFGPWAQRTLLTGAGAGLEATEEKLRGEKLDPAKIAMSGAFMGVASKQTKLGSKLADTFTPRTALVTPEMREWTTEDLKTWEIPPELVMEDGTKIKVNQGTVMDRPHPESLKETAFRDPKTGEIIPSGARHDEDIKDSGRVLEQGFLDHTGTFLTRTQAAGRAYKYHSDKLEGDIDFDGKFNLDDPRPSQQREPGLHSSDFGREGVSNLHTSKPRLKPDGSPVLGTFDRLNKEITIDKESIIKRWDKARIGGERLGSYFKSPGEFVGFVLAHEEAHSKVSRPSWVSVADHEDLVNRMALEKFNESPSRSIPDPSVPNVPKTNIEFGDVLFALTNNGKVDDILNGKFRQSAEKDGVTYDMMKKWVQYDEGTVKELTGKEKELYEKYSSPVSRETLALVKYLQDEGVIEKTELDPAKAGNVAVRETVKPEKTKWEKTKETLAGGPKGGFDQNIERVQGAAQERSYFVAEFPNGKRVVIQPTKDGILQHNKGKVTSFSKEKKVDLKAGQKYGNATIKHATVAEIEQHTETRYNKDYLSTQYKKLTELREMARAHAFIQNLKQSDYFKENSVPLKGNQNPPEGFVRPKHIERLPALQGYAFEPHVAAIIEDFSRTNNPNALTLISGTLVKNMMLNPLPHMLNEAWHVYNARGLTGWVTPKGIGRFVNTAMPAVREAMNQGPQFRDLLKDGASLLDDGRVSAIQESFFKAGAKEAMKTPEMAALAKEYGMSVGELYNALSKKSTAAMWVVRNAMYIQQINELMKYKGMTQKEAIHEVERHLPSYRLPTHVGEAVLGTKASRALSEHILQNPNVSVFSRYHYGMLHSLVETAKDLAAIRHGTKGLEQFGHGVDQAAAIAIALSVLYPLQDKLAHLMTNNPQEGWWEHVKAEQRRAGPYHIFAALADVVDHKKDPQAVLAAVFTFNPAFLMGAQLLFNIKLYNGQPVYHPGSVLPDLEKYFLGQVPQIQTSLKVSDDKTGGGAGQWMAQQLDIKTRTDAQIRKEEKQKHKTDTAAYNRKKKRESEE